MNENVELIQLCVENNQQAQSKLFEKYSKILTRYMYNRKVEEKYIDELLDIIFLRVYAKINLFSFEGSFEGWLQKIVRHAISDFFRVENKRKEAFEIEESHFYGTCSENDGLSTMVMNDYFKLIKDVLPYKQYFVFMKYYEGYSHKEIGTLLNISEGTSKWYVSEAKAILRQKIEL